MYQFENGDNAPRRFHHPAFMVVMAGFCDRMGA
jgi:hypothetical protein